MSREQNVDPPQPGDEPELPPARPHNLFLVKLLPMKLRRHIANASSALRHCKTCHATMRGQDSSLTPRTYRLEFFGASVGHSWVTIGLA